MHLMLLIDRLMYDEVCSAGGDVEHDRARFEPLPFIAGAVPVPRTAPDLFPPQHEDAFRGGATAAAEGAISGDRAAAAAAGSEGDLRSPPEEQVPLLLLEPCSPAQGALQPSEAATEAKEEGRQVYGNEMAAVVLIVDRSDADGPAWDITGVGPLPAGDDDVETPGVSGGTPPLFPVALCGSPGRQGVGNDDGGGGGCRSSDAGNGDSDGDLSIAPSEKRFPRWYGGGGQCCAARSLCADDDPRPPGPSIANESLEPPIPDVGAMGPVGGRSRGTLPPSDSKCEAAE